jgi:hypothetical protein
MMRSGDPSQNLVRENPRPKTLKGKQAKIAKGISKKIQSPLQSPFRTAGHQAELKYWEDKYYRFTKKTGMSHRVSSTASWSIRDHDPPCRRASETVYPNVYPVLNGNRFRPQGMGIQNQDAVKNRDSHLHQHADALVIAALDPPPFYRVCTALKAKTNQRSRVHPLTRRLFPVSPSRP